MLYTYYFERDQARSHISLVEWTAAVTACTGVRIVRDALDRLGDWIGYGANPHETTGTSFHVQSERVHDAEVYFPANDKWRRAFYWHNHSEPGCGVVTFESCPGSVSPEEYPVWIAAQELAARLGAELVSEDETNYEN